MSIMSMIKCARRELRLRQEFYPRRVQEGRVSPETAQHEIDCMRAICELLDRVQQQEQEGGIRG